MASPSVTYTFSNSTTADATQVNQNFTDLINGMSDGTKDFSISALTCAGTATLNGNVNIGNASGDDLTITASLASSIAIKTTFSYDIGAATLGLKYIFLGSADSAARTTKIAGATVASSWTMTLPTGVPAQAGFALVSTTSGVTSWQEPYLASNPQSATYVLTMADKRVDFTTSTSTLDATLPTAVGCSGKPFTIKKVDQSTGKVVLKTTSSQTIDGLASAAIILGTIGDSITVESNGSNWVIVNFDIFVGISVANSAGTTLTRNTETTVPFATETYDPWGAWATPTFTAPIAGKYEIKVNLTVTSGATWAAGDYLLVIIDKSGTDTLYKLNIQQAAHTTLVNGSIEAVIALAAGETMEIHATAQRVAAGDVTLLAQATNNYMSITRIGN